MEETLEKVIVINNVDLTVKIYDLNFIFDKKFGYYFLLDIENNILDHGVTGDLTSLNENHFLYKYPKVMKIAIVNLNKIQEPINRDPDYIKHLMREKPTFKL